LRRAGFEVDLLERITFTPTPKGESFIEELCSKGMAAEQDLLTAEFIFRACKAG